MAFYDFLWGPEGCVCFSHASIGTVYLDNLCVCVGGGGGIFINSNFPLIGDLCKEDEFFNGNHETHTFCI